MNTRIQELADQAKSLVPKGILSPELWIEQYNQRFAELIIRECADIATMNGHQWESPGNFILKHFGVE